LLATTIANGRLTLSAKSGTFICKQQHKNVVL